MPSTELCDGARESALGISAATIARSVTLGSRALGVALLSLVTACATIPSLEDTQGQIARYIGSGQYEKEFAAVVTRAQTYMERRAGVVSKPAIVLDIDETSLSNWPAYRMNGWSRITAGPCDLDHGPCGIRAWQGMATSKILAPTLELREERTRSASLSSP